MIDPPLRRLCRQPSPNFGPRNNAIPLRLVVLHYTGMLSTAAALARLCNKESGVSAHYLIDDDGAIYQLVDDDKRAWHAGKACWRGERDVNSASIGIELSNPGHAFGYRSFPAEQIAALKELLADLFTRHATLDPLNIWGHADVAPLRKEDPGELFPWRDLAASGFGIWPHDEDVTAARVPPTLEPDAAGDLLRQIGYEADNADALRASLIAFQRHFCGTNLSGLPDAETSALIRAVAQHAIRN